MMRAGPLSDDRIIDLLNHYFIPVSISNDAHTRGEISKEDLELKHRIVRESWEDAKTLRTGEDAVYVVDANGKFYDAIRAPHSIEIGYLLPFLDKVAGRLGVKKGAAPVVEPTRQSTAPATKEGEFVLHLTARYEPKGDGWAKLPAEDWIVLKREEWQKLLPPAGTKVGQPWQIDSDVAKKLLINFYPPTGNTDLKKNIVAHMKLNGTLVSNSNGTARVKLGGSLKMKHPFFTTGIGPAAQVQDTAEYLVVVDRIAGFIDCDLEKPAIRSLRVIGDDATYRSNNFVVALRSLETDNEHTSRKR